MAVKFFDPSLLVTIITVSSSSPQTPAPSTVRRSSVTKWIIVFILRLVVLSGFTAGAIALGMMAGHLMPTQEPRPPLFLRLWRNQAPTMTAPQPVLNPTVAALGAEEKLAIEQEIQGIQEQLQVLMGRTQKLETELKLDPQNGDLSDRLNNLTVLLTQDPAELPTNPPPQAPTISDHLKITLPTAVLFDGSGQLTPEAEEILDAIAIDLQQEQAKTITIAGHAAAKGQVKAEERSFLQAEAVKLYLQAQVPGKYRWVVVGYGATQPLPGANAQTNQRLEIVTE